MCVRCSYFSGEGGKVLTLTLPVVNFKLISSASTSTIIAMSSYLSPHSLVLLCFRSCPGGCHHILKWITLFFPSGQLVLRFYNQLSPNYGFGAKMEAVRNVTHHDLMQTCCIWKQKNTHI